MRSPLPAKHLPDGRAMLNIGCGWVTHPDWNNLDFGPYARLKRRPLLTALLGLVGILTEQRRQRLAALDPDIIAWDVLKGLPFPDTTFDVVYHSNLIEHLSQQAARVLLSECHQVLKSGGVLRVVTPNVEALAAEYSKSLAEVDSSASGAAERHEQALKNMFEQMVRDEGEGSKPLSRLARFLENLLRGGAAKRGEKHLWAYDRASLGRFLREVGFDDARIVRPDESCIAGWGSFGLDVNERGKVRHESCLYMEAVKA